MGPSLPGTRLAGTSQKADGQSISEANMQQSAIVEYSHDGYLCEGFAVWGDTGPRRPGILVFPEWTGVGEYTHKRAQMLG